MFFMVTQSTASEGRHKFGPKSSIFGRFLLRSIGGDLASALAGTWPALVLSDFRPFFLGDVDFNFNYLMEEDKKKQ